MSLSGQKVLVTGATGFIGSRLVELLIQEHGASVRALVHNFTHATRLARFPVEMVQADIADADAVCRAASGCDVILHAAVGSSGTPAQQRAATIQGTEAVMQAARVNRTARVVHFSTISVYGLTRDGSLSERSQRGWLPDAYSRDKSDAEAVALSYHRKHGVPVAVIQPTVVYGPFSGGWTVAPLAVLHAHKQVIPDGGGLCNAVYVDDVVQATLQAATRPEAIGETFLVSADQPVTWREFYAAYERMLGAEAVVAMQESEFRRASRSWPWQRFVRDVALLVQHPGFVGRVNGNWLLRTACGGARAIVPAGIRRWVLSHYTPPALANKTPAEKTLFFPDKWRFRWQQARTHVEIDKARACLGYAPAFDLRRGMALTHAWAHWANLPGVVAPRKS